MCKLIDVPPTEDIRYTAAADHCLAAAYAGLCPNIDPERMRLWRGRSRAQFKKMALAQFEKSLQETINQLRDRPTITIGGFKFIDAMDSEYRELVDASAIIGLGAMFSYFDRRKNRFKVAAINGAPAAMAAWIEWSKQQPYFEDQWGDPQRGFAGAYVIPTDRPSNGPIQKSSSRDSYMHQQHESSNQIQVREFTVIREGGQDCYVKKDGQVIGHFRLNDFNESTVRGPMIMLGII